MSIKYYKISENNTMKARISATIDEKTARILNELVKDGTFRNKSHVIEKAIQLMKKEKEE